MFVDFEAPPVVEVVCGVVFKPVQGLSTAHLGLLWERFGAEFTQTSDHPPLPSPIPLDEAAQVQLSLTTTPPLRRVWFSTEDGRRLIQVQPNRLHFNWRRKEPDDEYPRFHTVYREFLKYLKTFDGFLADAGGQILEPTGYELTYLNIIPADQVWERFEQIGLVMPDISWRDAPGRFLPPPDALRWESEFSMPNDKGKLFVNVRSARNRSTGERALSFDLTARGSAETASMDDWFEQGHEWVVRGFDDLTGQQQKHLVWRKRAGKEERS